MINDVAYCLFIEGGEPSNYQEAINSSDSSLWMTTMQREFEAPCIRTKHGNIASKHNL